MAFRGVDFAHLVRFNSSTSCKLIDSYESYVRSQLMNKSAEVKSCTFAPSSFRCDRKNWFRLRGTKTDVLTNPDLVLNFQAEVGTARHAAIQERMQSIYGNDWLDVEEYLATRVPKIPYEYTVSKHGLETLVSITDPPVRFACDGLIRINGTVYLLEIKTADYKSWDSLTAPKDVHIDQIRCYCALLGIHNVLVLYEDRQHGELKCFEISFTDADLQSVMDKFKYIQRMADSNLAPARLDFSDYMCLNCEYRVKCAQWG